MDVSSDDLSAAHANAWCVVSHHKAGGAASLCFGDPQELFGIGPEQFSEAAIEAALVGELQAKPWRQAAEATRYLIALPHAAARWLESASTRTPDGGLLMSTRAVPLGGYEEVIARARLSLGGSLLGPMAHELNNLIQGLSSAEYLFRDCLESNDPIEMEDVDQLAEAVGELKTMGRQLQSFARIGPAEPELVVLPRLLRNAENFLTSIGRLGVVDYRNEVSDDIPDLYWRAFEIDFVVLALLANAADASLEPGDNAHVLVTATVQGDRLILVFTNTGPKLKLPEQSVPGATSKTEHRHQGLGLSVVLAILATRGGALRVAESEQGTTLIADLPLVAKQDPSATGMVATVPIA